MSTAALEDTSAVHAVLSSPDLLGLVLGCVGPVTFACARRVCKAWLDVCSTDERVLRSVALYSGGLTKSTFTRLFAVSGPEADTLPRSTYRRAAGGKYFLYGADAVDTVLADGGLARRRGRLQLCAPARPSLGPALLFPKSARRAFKREERLHARICAARAC